MSELERLNALVKRCADMVSVSFNSHRAEGLSVSEWVDGADLSPGARRIEGDDQTVGIILYPQSSVGFFEVRARTLREALDKAEWAYIEEMARSVNGGSLVGSLVVEAPKTTLP